MEYCQQREKVHCTAGVLIRAGEFVHIDMEDYPSRRTGGGLVISRKASSIVPRDSADIKNRNAQICSRIGCSSKLNSTEGTQIGCSDKAKSSRRSFRPSSSGKEIIGSSSRTSNYMNSPRKPCSDSHRKLPYQLETDSETSSLIDESDVTETVLTHGKTQIQRHAQAITEGASSSSVSHSRHVKETAQKFGLGNQDNSLSGSSVFKHTNPGARNSATASRYNLRNLRCNSISDIIPSGCSSSESSLGKKRDIGQKRVGEAESSSSARGKKISGPLVGDRRNDNPNRGISISDSRRGRNLATGRDDGAISVRTRRSAARAELSEQENRNRLPFPELPILTPLLPQPDMPVDANTQNSENQLSVQAPFNRTNSSSCPGSSGENVRNHRSIGPFEVGIAHSFMNHDSLRQYNLDGIAELLLALDRIEQDEELTYEQLLVLETNLFLGGLVFHDQHRDMRLDIDNMSYEELLALEERMGTVSTALTEEELEKCLRRSVYQNTTLEAGTSDNREEDNDIKCSICQEEYVAGDEVCRLGCNHRYHMDCVQLWLRLKNWCPVCKASAAPSSASPSF
ncbi:hypothetical protein Ancab_023127 [Ancistrocladus abbreviatus]